LNGEKKRMDELKIGDTVLTGYKKFSPVYLFSHADAESDTLFVQLEFNSVQGSGGSGVEGNTFQPLTLSPLTLSPGHFIYIVEEGAAASEVENGTPKMKAIPARDIRIGDIVQTGDGDGATSPLLTKVVRINSVRGKGLYNPHTLDGDIIVDGILTTVYTDAIRPELAHALLAPVRALYKMNVSVGG
jgi:hypothetical protein